ncbi:hypothetical protein OUZ56_003239 [Daphnia magna]|uniref:THAP-type domain-containing protein n=1 Tax=Daphnia magna TaxID=35525 RepID=A0ABR0A852_9CRUS|nr:hypothetical protein OUZ56_003239 [Daphnia magna]
MEVIRRMASPNMSKFYKKCVVKGCPNNGIGDKSVGVRFFGIPVSPDNRNPSDSIIIQQRRELWLARLNINDANIKTKHLVCNLHFASGKPSYYLQKNHPDWAPSSVVGYTYNREAMFMNTLANYTQPKKKDNSNSTIHSPHPFEVNENLNSSEVLLAEELQDSPMDLSTSKPCHSLVDEEPSSSEHSPQLVSELQKEIEKLTAQLEKINAEYVSLKKEFAMYCNRPINHNQCQPT